MGIHRDTGRMVARGSAENNGYRTEWYIRCIDWVHERPIPDCPYVVWVKYIEPGIAESQWRIHAATQTHSSARRSVGGKVKWDK